MIDNWENQGYCMSQQPDLIYSAFNTQATHNKEYCIPTWIINWWVF